MIKTIVLCLGLFWLIPLTAWSQSDNKDDCEYCPGKIYLKSGEILEGFVKYGYDHRRNIKFKESLDGKKKKFHAMKVRSFLIQSDSFAVFKNVPFQGAAGGKNMELEDFVKILKKGKLSLGEHYSSQGNPGGYGQAYKLTSHIFIKDLGDNQHFALEVIRSKNKHFIKDMIPFFYDDASIQEKVKSEEWTAENSYTILEYYNESH